MKRLFVLSACVTALLISGCSKKPDEVPVAVKAEAEMLISEAQFATSIREFSRAEELIQRAIKLRDGMPDYWVSLGMTQRRQENKKDARKSYEKALKIHAARYKKEPSAEELFRQAYVMALLGRTDEALKLLNKGVKDHPDSEMLKKMADPRGLQRTFQSPQFKEVMI